MEIKVGDIVENIKKFSRYPYKREILVEYPIGTIFKVLNVSLSRTDEYTYYRIVPVFGNEDYTTTVHSEGWLKPASKAANILYK